MINIFKKKCKNNLHWNQKETKPSFVTFVSQIFKSNETILKQLESVSVRLPDILQLEKRTVSGPFERETGKGGRDVQVSVSNRRQHGF